MSARPRIVVLGGSGQLGSALARAGGHGVIALGRTQADVTDPGSLHAALAATRPDIVVNAAAYTAVDRAESEPQRCFAVNRDGAGHVAAAAAAIGARLIHLSTDYVFDGTKGAPYREDDARNPLNAYGAAKAGGEDLVLARHPEPVILRTAWLFGLDRPNFVRTVLRLALCGMPLRFVSDQLGSPTPAPGLARIVLAVAQALADGISARGVFHAAGAPAATWHDVAATAVTAIFPAAIRPAVRAIPSSAYPTPARRPADTRLECARLGLTFGLGQPDWRAALPRLAAALGAQEAEKLRESGLASASDSQRRDRAAPTAA
jgi:dTDP-4-dehydrorhamnose reductase